MFQNFQTNIHCHSVASTNATVNWIILFTHTAIDTSSVLLTLLSWIGTSSLAKSSFSFHSVFSRFGPGDSSFVIEEITVRKKSLNSISLVFETGQSSIYLTIFPLFLGSALWFWHWMEPQRLVVIRTGRNNTNNKKIDSFNCN